jgi:hypothetical protein|nr:MAG TPA_asm: hypothetical protein [Caudoviricetes sp.]
MTNFSLKTKFTDGGEVYLLSTVRLLDFLSDAQYETMVFKVNYKNEVDYNDLYCQRYYTQQEAEEGHKDLLLRAERGERFWKTI